MRINFWIELPQRPRLRVQVAAHDLVLGLRSVSIAKRWTAGQHFIQHTAETVDIGAMVNRMRLNLLRTHIIRRANVCPKPSYSWLSHHQGNPEIDQICVSIRPHEDI